MDLDLCKQPAHYSSRGWIAHKANIGVLSACAYSVTVDRLWSTPNDNGFPSQYLSSMWFPEAVYARSREDPEKQQPTAPFPKCQGFSSYIDYPTRG